MMTTLKDKSFYKSIFTLAIPVIIQNIIMVSINNVDSLMIGQLGEKAIAGVGIANQIYFLFSFFLYGITGGSSVFMAQFFGKKDYEGLNKSLNLCLIINAFIGTIFSIIAIFLPSAIISLYTTDKEVISIGAKYLRIVGFSYIFTAFSFGFAASLRSIQNTIFPSTISTIAMLINIVLNYLLIYGNFNFPKLGVEGAAIGTVIARIFEFSSLMIITKKDKLLIFKNMFKFDLQFIPKFAKITIPGMLTSAVWSFGMIAYNIIYSRLGTEWFAAINVANTIEGLAFTVFGGMCTAAVIMIGNKIGANEKETAYSYSKVFLLFNFILALLAGSLLIIGGSQILGFYKVNDSTISYAKYLLLIYGCMLWIKVLNMTFFMGILQAGGDTRYKFMLASIAMWAFGVPLMALAAFILKLPYQLVILFILFEEVIKLFGVFHRFFSKRWLKDLTIS